MDAARLTDERLRSWLNSNQSSRERMCAAILALDRSYSSIRQRRPEGGPDGGRDIECLRLGEPCLGAVGFLNNVSDSASDKRSVRRKFLADVKAARDASPESRAFVFFCNVDLTPAEIANLEAVGREHEFTFVDLYGRERLRHALDSVEGLAIRFQYLSLPLSEAEQVTFFGRFGKDITDLLRGRFDQLEQKLDAIEFARWKAGQIRSLALDIQFKKYVESKHSAPEHFRVCLELQGLMQDERSIILGGRDDFWKSGDGAWHFGTKTFFWRQRVGNIGESWVPQHVRVGGGIVTGIHLGVEWRPISPVMAAEFDGLSKHLHFTENLLDRISRVRFCIDDYVFLDWAFQPGRVKNWKPSLGWPEALRGTEAALAWLCVDLGWLCLEQVPRRKADCA